MKPDANSLDEIRNSIENCIAGIKSAEKRRLRRRHEKKLTALIDRFVEAGGDINHSFKANHTLLQFAAQYCSSALVKKLLEKGADPTGCAGKNSGSSPYSLAMHKMNYGAVNLIEEKLNEAQRKQARCEYVKQRIEFIVPIIYDDEKCSWQMAIEFLKLCQELKQLGVEESNLWLPYLGSTSHMDRIGAWALPHEIGVNVKLNDAALFIYNKGFLSKEELKWFASNDQQFGVLIEKLEARPKPMSFYIYLLKKLFGEKAADDGYYCEAYTELSLFINLRFSVMDDDSLIIDHDTLAKNDRYKKSYAEGKKCFAQLNQEIERMNSYLDNMLEPINSDYHNGIKISAENVKRLREGKVFFDIKPSKVAQKTNYDLQGHNLPNELLLAIFQYLSVPDLQRIIPLVNRNWRVLAQDNKLWELKFNSTYPRYFSRSGDEEYSDFYKAFRFRQLRVLTVEGLGKMVGHIMEAKNNGFFIVSTEHVLNKFSDRKINAYPDCIIIRDIPRNYALTILRFMREKYHVDLSQKGVLVRENTSGNFDIRISIPQLKTLLNKIKTYNTPNYNITLEMQETDQMLVNLQGHLNHFVKQVAIYRLSDTRAYPVGYGPPGPITLTELMSHVLVEKKHVIFKNLSDDKARIIIDFIENIYNKNVCKTLKISPIEYSKNDYVIPSFLYTLHYADIKFSHSSLRNLFSAINKFNQSAVSGAIQQSSPMQSGGLFAPPQPQPQPQPAPYVRNIQHPNEKLQALSNIINQKLKIVCSIQKCDIGNEYSLVFDDEQTAKEFENEYGSYGYSLGKEFSFYPGDTSKFLELFSLTQEPPAMSRGPQPSRPSRSDNKPPEKSQVDGCRPS